MSTTRADVPLSCTHQKGKITLPISALPGHILSSGCAHLWTPLHEKRMENSVESSHNISGLKCMAQENLSKKPSGLEMALSDIRAVIISKGLLEQKPKLGELLDQNHSDLVAELRINSSLNILNPKTIMLGIGLDALENPFGSQIPISMRMRLHHFSHWCLADFRIICTLKRGREILLPSATWANHLRAKKLTYLEAS